MKVVCAGLGHNVNDAAKDRSELSFVRMGDDLELLDGIHNRRHGIGAEKGTLIDKAVGQEVVTAIRLPVNSWKNESRSDGGRSGEPASATHIIVL